MTTKLSLDDADRCFREAEVFCRRDDGALWDVQLYGPMLLVEPNSRQVVANRPDAERNLARSDKLYVGEFPKELNVANGVADWGRVHWTILMWPLPAERNERVRLMLHELWHRVQDDIGLPATNPANGHLDTREGRYWLQLEWRALHKSLTCEGEASRRAVGDAICFRNYRRGLFPDASAEERALEMHEGLAEYTGVRLSSSGAREAMSIAARCLQNAPDNPTFVRSFAYASGPAYGLLLDIYDAMWRIGLWPSDDLGLLLSDALSIPLPQGLAAEARRRASDYGGDALLASETKRHRVQQDRAADYLARLVEGPVLELPNHRMSVQFDPRNLFPLGEHGTVYPTARLTDDWGVLTASNGVLIGPDWRAAFVTAPAGPRARPLAGDGWVLELNEGWTVAPGQREQDYVATPVGMVRGGHLPEA
ncbi:MAG: hypothetical protein JW759_09420 [Candidatus Coatesbacteria bacterium]|nr:hypothetical protein [Candidatus Coatesbacteria bacterium]